MQIIVTGHQVAITDALREYVTSKFERIVRHFDHLHNVTVVLSVEKLLHTVEATVNCSGKKIVHAEAQATDMYAAIDALVHKLDRQVTKHKEKIKDHHRDEGRDAARHE
ncbi:MAG: ribosome-associated translation inhibitor RaiA [Rudaea sp.]